MTDPADCILRAAQQDLDDAREMHAAHYRTHSGPFCDECVKGLAHIDRCERQLGLLAPAAEMEPLF